MTDDNLPSIVKEVEVRDAASGLIQTRKYIKVVGKTLDEAKEVFDKVWRENEKSE